MKLLLLSIVALVLAIAPAHAVPQMIHYQGRVSLNGTLVNGPSEFKFALVNGDGSAVFWTNNGTYNGPNHEPAGGVTLTVANGLYSVLLGDAALAGMTALPPTVFANADVRLRVWYDAGVANGGWQLLTPDQRIASVGYAMMAGSVPDASITGEKLAPEAVAAANIAPGAVTLSKIDFSGAAAGQFLTTGGGGATWQSVGWGNLAGIPAGFADGADNDTLFTAGAGLSLAGTEFSLNFAGSGVANTATRSDHHHLGADWTGSFAGSAFNIQNTAADGIAMSGLATGTSGIGFTGIATGTSGIGVAGNSNSGYGVSGSTTTGTGVFGSNGDSNTAGYAGYFQGRVRVTQGLSVSGAINAGTGVSGFTSTGSGIYGSNGGSNTTGHAAYFDGRVRATGELKTDDMVWATGPGYSGGIITRAEMLLSDVAGFFDGNVLVWGSINTGIVEAETGVVAGTGGMTSPAINIAGGTICVSGAGVNTSTAAFVHQATAGSLRTLPGDTVATATIIDHPRLNNNGGAALLFVTHLAFTPNPTAKGGASVFYDIVGVHGGTPGRWLIRVKQDGAGASIAAGDSFSVLFIEP